MCPAPTTAQRTRVLFPVVMSISCDRNRPGQCERARTVPCARCVRGDTTVPRNRVQRGPAAVARGMLASHGVTTAATHGAPTASNLREPAPRLTGIFATLVDEHADLERLIGELAALDEGEVQRRRELFTRIAYRLAVHADAE